MRLFIFLSLTIFTLTIHLTHGGIFRRYVRKHRPGGVRLPPHHMIASRSRMGPQMMERQFRLRERPWVNMVLRRPRAPAWPPIFYHYPLQMPLMFQTPGSRRSSRRFRFYERQDNRVPQFHHQPVTARHHHPIGISTTTRLPTTTAVQWRPFDYGNPIDRDPTYDYAPPAVERVRFISEVPGGGRQPTARANGMMGMYSRPAPVVVPAPWPKRDQGVQLRGRHPLQHHQLHHQPTLQHQHHHHHHHLPHPPPPRGAFPLWKLLAHKQRPKRPHRPARPQQTPPVRFIGQDPAYPLYHHQAVYPDEAEVHPNIRNIVYFQPTDVVPTKIHHAKKTPPAVSSPGLKPGSVSNAELYPSEVSSSSEFRPVKATSQKPTGNKDYRFTVVGYTGPATTPMTPVAAAPSTSGTTRRTPTLLYAVKTTPETLSTTHNSVVKPLEPTESLEPQEAEYGSASELRPVHVLPDQEVDTAQEVVDGREQGGVDHDFADFVDNINANEEVESSGPGPLVPNSFNVFDSLLSSFEKEFGDDTNVGDGEDNEEEEAEEVKESHHRQRVPVFTPTEESIPAPVDSTTAPPAKSNFETSTSISVSVGVSHSSSSSSSKKNHKEEVSDNDNDGTDGVFAIRTVPTTTTTTTSTTTTTPRPVTTTTTTESPAATTTTTTTTSTSKPSTSTAYPRLPTMPTYKRKPTPVYARKGSKAGGLLTKYSSSSSSSSSSKEVSATGGGVPNGSGEIVIITAGRSKVKEYKPQVIANQTHLLAFDKVVAPVDGEGVKESPILLDSSPSSTSTTKSPLEEFDAMQLIHSWLVD